MRRDLEPIHRGDEIAFDLRILTSRRLDLAADRTRAINRMRAQMLEYFPALKRSFDYKTSKASLVLLTCYQTPTGRPVCLSHGRSRLIRRMVRSVDALCHGGLSGFRVSTAAPCVPIGIRHGRTNEVCRLIGNRLFMPRAMWPPSKEVVGMGPAGSTPCCCRVPQSTATRRGRCCSRFDVEE
jgi:hypothetical protein